MGVDGDISSSVVNLSGLNNSSKKIKSLHKKIFLSPSKMRRSERIAKKKFDK